LADLGTAIKTESGSKLTCSECGLTYEEFGRTGRLGCASCYDSFERVLLPLIKRLQRGSRHAGKSPAKLGRNAKTTVELRELEKRLQKLIEAEEFEEAAGVRDQIHKMEAKMKKPKKRKK
jgi:protein arginine kinase activator